MFPLVICLRGASGYELTVCTQRPHLNTICILQVDKRAAILKRYAGVEEQYKVPGGKAQVISRQPNHSTFPSVFSV